MCEDITVYSPLMTAKWDLEYKSNNLEHHTDLNGVERLIVRRGQPFTVTLYLKSVTRQSELSALQFSTETGVTCSEETGNKAVFGLSDSIGKSCWGASISRAKGDSISVSIYSPPDAPIGLYTLTLIQAVNVVLGKFVLLFNPWCSGDAVYMDCEEKRMEYVLSQDGVIYRGTPKHIVASPWRFGQFESGVLDACLRILDENPKCLKNPGKDCSARRNPVYVSRVLSAMVNCNDDKGVLQGNWSDDYSGGKMPSYWTNSTEILRQWNDSCCRKVRYGQCWVFAAVACTVSRALGIPCRVVTNFDSAHDRNKDLIIEMKFNEDGKYIQGDSVWNFHVWVESWMTRPDLEPHYNGWQASDPTPQEKSDGIFCCGPVPTKAIKEGELTVKYDAPFVFAEVNADVVNYIKLRDGQLIEVSGSSDDVGHCISTKSVGNDSREDITHQYKYPEGSEKEREVFKKAKHQNKLQQMGVEPHFGVKIKVLEGMKKGRDFDVFAVISNKTAKSTLCQVNFYGHAVLYNGKLRDVIGEMSEDNLQIPPDSEKRVSLRLSYKQYKRSVNQDNLIRLNVLVADKNTHEFYKASRTIVLENPEIIIKILESPKMNKSLDAEISLKNPLCEQLKNCSFSIEGSNLIRGKIVQKIPSIKPQEEVKVSVCFTPKCWGLRKLLVDFNCEQLRNVKGFKNILIEK